MRIPMYIVDAFTAVPFRGNPAAVCLLDDEPEKGWMQSVAAEMNLSETAFLRPAAEGVWDLRWFTPKVEVDLCGHATLAAAHVLWSTGRCEASTIAFSTRSGTLRAGRREDCIELDFPRRDAVGVEPPENLIEALGIMPSFVGRSGEGDYLVAVDRESEVRSLRPDFALLGEVEARGVIVTAPAGDEGAGRTVAERAEGESNGVWHFVSRFFAPACGILEDPVTGSAHCALGPYWSRRLRRDQLVGYQASERGGLVRVRVDLERVHLGGQAVTVLEGELRI